MGGAWIGARRAAAVAAAAISCWVSGLDAQTTGVEALVDSLVEAERARRPVAGMVVAVVRGTDTLVLEGYGHADLEHDVAMTPDAVFRIASLTKQFTAAAVLRLTEGGLVSLDDRPVRHVPSFPDTSGAVRVRQLLNHTSGLPDIYELDGWTELRPQRPPHHEARARMTRLLEASGLHSAPGRSYRYSNAGYDVLGDLIEAVSGQPYGDFLEQALFGPLGLSATRFCAPEDVVRHRAEGYDVADGSYVNAFRLSPHYLFASGGLCSDARDLVRWSRALHGGEVLSAESYRRMTTPEGGARSYGYGIGVGAVEGRAKLGHNGSLPGFSAQLDHYPDDDLIVVVLANAPAAVGALAEDVARFVLGLPPRPMATAPEGWRVLAEPGSAARDSIDFRVMGAGVHATTGPGGLYFHPDSAGEVPYDVEATFIQIGEPTSDEGLGLMLAGRDPGSAAPTHLLFRVRADGAWRVELREGAETARVLRPWRRHEAVVQMSGRGGRNTLRAEVRANHVILRVNGAEVGRVTTGELGSVGGVAGLFVGGGHDAHIDGFRIEPSS